MTDITGASVVAAAQAAGYPRAGDPKILETPTIGGISRIVVASGNIFSGGWYPILVALMTLVLGLLYLLETKDRDIDADDGPRR